VLKERWWIKSGHAPARISGNMKGMGGRAIGGFTGKNTRGETSGKGGKKPEVALGVSCQIGGEKIIHMTLLGTTQQRKRQEDGVKKKRAEGLDNECREGNRQGGDERPQRKKVGTSWEKQESLGNSQSWGCTGLVGKKGRNGKKREHQYPEKKDQSLSKNEGPERNRARR